MKVASGVTLLVGLLIFASVFVSAQQNCFKCGSPRATECQGNLSRLSAELCRVAQVNAGSLACQRHRRELEKDDNRCSSPMHGTTSDKTKLSKIPIPKRLYRLFDELGGGSYRPGTKWCCECRNTFREGETIKEKYSVRSAYIPPKKRTRNKVSILLLLPFKRRNSLVKKYYFILFSFFKLGLLFFPLNADFFTRTTT